MNATIARTLVCRRRHDDDDRERIERDAPTDRGIPSSNAATTVVTNTTAWRNIAAGFAQAGSALLTTLQNNTVEESTGGARSGEGPTACGRPDGRASSSPLTSPSRTSA